MLLVLIEAMLTHLNYNIISSSLSGSYSTFPFTDVLLVIEVCLIA